MTSLTEAEKIMADSEKFLVLTEFVVKKEIRHDRLKLCPENSQHASTRVYQSTDESDKTA
jgi:hypothetical protein